MGDVKTILVTGVAGPWGARVARRLLQQPDLHVIGVDTAVPAEPPPLLDFVQADVRNPLLVELLRAERVDAVCHLAFAESRRRSEQLFEVNVMGAMRVFGACAEAGVRKIVHRSSTAVYGALPTNPAFLAEAHPLQGSRSHGAIRYMLEIEEFCDGFRQQQPEIGLTTLRFANILGKTADTPLAKLLGGRSAPILLGFDPMMQLVHETDVVEALVHALLHDVPGTFNVAAEGLMPLTRLLTLTRTLPVPLLHPLAYWGAGTLPGRLNPMRYLPLGIDALRYRCVGDLAQMHAALGFEPRYTAAEAVEEFAGQKRMRGVAPDEDVLAFDEARLRGTLQQRRREKARRGAGREVTNG
ncbi:MAG: NAD-dependent epimerase/dehydratase family protein [Anaerolineales bacterium]|nr:NAD-dependent epimerase/dehydratase family protein [Anaerolineales bacterium]